MMSKIKVKTGFMTAVFCLMALSFSASAVTDPDIISGVTRINSTLTPVPLVVKGGLTTGVYPHSDRTTITFGNIGYLGGMDYVQSVMDDKADADVQYQVTLNKAGTLYLIVDNRVGDGNISNEPNFTSVMTWVPTAGFTSTGITIDMGNGTTPATVYSLPVAGAGTVTLNQQNDGTTRAMYVVAAAPTGWDITTNQAPLIAGVSLALTTRVPSVAIDATITDDGVPATPGLSIAWSTVSQPAGATATFAPSATVEDVTITLSAYGVYTFKVTASDGDKAISKTVQVTYADTFAVQSSQRVIACNDSDKGPTSSYTSTQLHVRNNSATRRRVSYCRYSIGSIKTPGKVFADSYLTWNFAARTSNRNIYVYGIKEEIDNISLSGMNWTTAFGIDNTPVPPLGTEITIDTLDTADITPLLLSYKPAGTGTWLSTPPSVNMDDFLNSDTDGDVTLMFITYEPQNTDFQIYDQTDSRIEPVTNLKGVILRGTMSVPIWAYNPVPVNNSTVATSLTQLSWTKPDPNQPGGAITSDVYFRVMTGDPNDDPNYALPDYGSKYTRLAAGITGNSLTLPFALESYKSYRWIVDTHDTTRDEIVRGYLWTFNTNNMAPSVDAGTDQYVWLNNNGDPNSATVNLNGTTSDDGQPYGTYTKQWTQLSGTAITISPDNVDDTSVVLPATGTYQFTLTANDGNAQMADTVRIVVSANPCAAAQAISGYIPIVGDLDDDCGVDIDDLSLFVADWLECHPFMDAPCF